MKNNRLTKITVSALFIALATVLSLVKLYELPLGGAVTLLSMLPIVMVSGMLGVKWGLVASFVYSLIQLGFGIADGLFGWGLTPICLIGVILLDYIVPFTLLGLAGIAAKKGSLYLSIGTVVVMVLRFLSHFISGYVIFANFEQFVVFGQSFINRPMLYSVCYNGAYMLPELILTSIAAFLLFKVKAIRELFVR